jgi:hypothetical membrane protein
MNRSARIAGQVAWLVFVASAMVFGAILPVQPDGFSHITHPLTWLGAEGVPSAVGFNLCGLVLPGLLAAFALWSIRSAMPKGTPWAARIGAQLVVLSAFAFAAQGLLPLDLEDPDGGPHTLVWTLWWIAFVPGAALLAWGLRRISARPGVVALSAIAAMALPLMIFAAPFVLPIAIAQRAAFLLWFAWVAWMTRAPPLSRA